jgi:hypothetical protein
MENMCDSFQGGPLMKQAMGNHGDFWSQASQLFFNASGPSTYTNRFQIAADKAGNNMMELWYTLAPDYGICEVWFNGAKAARWDGYVVSGVKRGKVEFPLTLKVGENLMEVRIVDKNPAAQGYRAGLDCFRLSPRGK